MIFPSSLVPYCFQIQKTFKKESDHRKSTLKISAKTFSNAKFEAVTLLTLSEGWLPVRVCFSIATSFDFFCPHGAIDVDRKFGFIS